MAMAPPDFLQDVIGPGLAWVARNGGPPVSRDAAMFLLAVAITETDLACRCQVLAGGTPGPAHSWFQFEQGGVRGVLQHDKSGPLAVRLCGLVHVVPSAAAVWRAIEGHDLLATAFARLLLWTDPKRVPVNVLEGWDCYAYRLWRPGKPDRERFGRAWATAADTIRLSP